MDDFSKGQGPRDSKNSDKASEKTADSKSTETATVSQDDHKEMVRRHLKVLLLHLAARSENPSEDLENLLHDVINELHQEVKDALEAKTHLRLVSVSDTMN